MTRILFVTPHAGGNVPPTLAIIDQLLAEGHDIRVLGHPQLASVFAGRDLEFLPFSQARQWSPISDRPSFWSMWGWLSLASDRGIDADVGQELSHRSADVVVVDCMVPVALRSARKSGAKVVLLMHAFSHYWVSLWSATNPLGSWLKVTGTHPSLHPADLGVVLTASELDQIDPSHIPTASVYQSGPIVPKIDSERVAERDLSALVSFSTISYPGQRGALQRTFDALASQPLRVVATVAPSLAPESLRVPQNVEVRGLVPHSEIFPSVRMLIGHGGHGTTMAALAHGVPVLVIAMSSVADQPLVGTAVERASVGFALSRRASVDEIGTAVRSMVADRGIAARAATLGAGWRDGGAVKAAASAILNAA